MRFLTSYYWQQGQGNRTSLTLQQIRPKKGKDSLLLACVCDNGHFCARLVDWLHEEILANYSARGGIAWDAAQDRLRGIAADAQAAFSCAGILCLGPELLLFGQGGHRIYLLNQSFGGRGAHIGMLMGTDGSSRPREATQRDDGREAFQLRRGLMEDGVGILLGTEPFYEKLTEQMLLDCLGGDIRDEKQASLRLRELGEYGDSIDSSRYICNPGAVFLRSYSEGLLYH